VPSLSLTGTSQQLLAEASAYYQAAQTALGNKDLATYQSDMDLVGKLLNQLQTQLGTPAPTP
jgi:hypothetical protein